MARKPLALLVAGLLSVSAGLPAVAAPLAAVESAATAVPDIAYTRFTCPTA